MKHLIGTAPTISALVHEMQKERGMSAGHTRFISLIAAQDTFLSVYKNYATTEQRAFLADTVKGAAVDEVARLRKIAITNPTTGTTEGIEATYWFQTITKKIELLKMVEDKVAQDLTVLLDEVEGTASKPRRKNAPRPKSAKL